MKTTILFNLNYSDKSKFVARNPNTSNWGGAYISNDVRDFIIMKHKFKPEEIQKMPYNVGAIKIEIKRLTMQEYITLMCPNSKRNFTKSFCDITPKFFTMKIFEKSWTGKRQYTSLLHDFNKEVLQVIKQRIIYKVAILIG